MNQKIISLVMFIFFSINLFSQITSKQKPLSFGQAIKSNVPTLTFLPGKEASSATEKNNPLRFAWLIKLNISPQKDGEWTRTEEGRIWRIKIKSPGAFSLNFLLKPFHLPKKAQLFFYNADSSFVVGAITSANNKKSNTLPIQAIPGKLVTIEYFLPKGIKFNNDFVIKQMGYDFKNAFGAQEAGSCEVNINCPEGDNWQSEKKAVARILISNQFYCSGALINNSRYDGRPYFFTAAHCVHYQADAENSIFYFNYESKQCDGKISDFNQTLSGSEVIATGKNEKLDFSLLLLSKDPPLNYHPYFAGWNRSSSPPNDVTCIHHPEGDIKKISRDYDTTVIGDFGSGYDTNSHWQILKWDVGTTEQGSSGSPLFNNKHQIVGDLTGGEANCPAPVNDYFSRIDRAWQDYSDPFYQLKNWLDPINSNITEIGGFDPYLVRYNLDLSAFSISNIKNISCSKKIEPQILLKNKGSDTIYNFSYNLVINDQILHFASTDTLLPSEYHTLKIPEQNLAFGDYQLKFIIDKVNAKKDEESSDDTLTTNFKLKNWTNLKLSFLTDGYAQESSWLIRNLEDSTLYQSTTMAPNSIYYSDFCIDKGCYALKVEDAGSDGICCSYGNGSYVLFDATRNDTLTTGGEFSDSTISNFCLNQDAQIVNNKIPYLLFPNPVKEYLTIYLYQNSQYILYIYKMNGKLQFHTKFKGRSIKINLSAWGNGIYYLKIKNGNNVLNTKFLIVK